MREERIRWCSTAGSGGWGALALEVLVDETASCPDVDNTPSRLQEVGVGAAGGQFEGVEDVRLDDGELAGGAAELLQRSEPCWLPHGGGAAAAACPATAAEGAGGAAGAYSRLRASGEVDGRREAKEGGVAIFLAVHGAARAGETSAVVDPAQRVGEGELLVDRTSRRSSLLAWRRIGD